MFCEFPAPETAQKSKGFPFELKNNHSATCYKHQPEEQPVGTMIMRIRTSIYEPFSAKSTAVNHQSTIEIQFDHFTFGNLFLLLILYHTLPTKKTYFTKSMVTMVLVPRDFTILYPQKTSTWRKPALALGCVRQRWNSDKGSHLLMPLPGGPPAAGAVASWWRSVASCFGGL